MSQNVWQLRWDREYISGSFQSASPAGLTLQTPRTAGNRLVTDLEADHYTVSSRGKAWAAPDNDRTRIPSGLRSNTNAFLREVLFWPDAPQFTLDLATGQSGNDRADLSNEFERRGVIILLADNTWFGFRREGTGVLAVGEIHDPYNFTFTGAAATSFAAFRTALSNTTGEQEAAMIIDDGTGLADGRVSVLGEGVALGEPLTKIVLGDGTSTGIEIVKVVLGDGTSTGIEIQ